MAATPQRNDFNSRIERLERAVGNLQRNSTLSSASISEGNLTVRRGGNIRVIDGGSIIGEGEGNLNWEGSAHFGGDLTIDGNTILGGNLQFGDEVIPPEALAVRTEAKTFSSQGSGMGNTRTESVNVNVPGWAATCSVLAFGVSTVTSTPARALSRVTIDGNVGPEVDAASELALAVPAIHSRNLTPSGNFTVSVFAGLQGTASAAWTQIITALCVFTN